MNILYITNYNSSFKYSGGYLNDYLNDLLFHGLHELENVNVLDSTPIIHLYKNNEEKINPQFLWGKGFTSTYLIDNDNIDRTNIEEKIKDKHFDLIIYGSVHRCLDYYPLVSFIYPSNKILLIDGEDSPLIHSISNKHPYFKRELTSNEHIPISFAIPECKITTQPLDKIQEFGKIIPGQGGYIFDNESDYYGDYNKSFYGVTMKKAGWDCMRHYEVLSNRCVPYFIGLEDCPKQTLTTLPKELLLEARNIADNFEEEKYFSILDELFSYTKNNLTTKHLAQYVLSHVH
jgi:hypothetical protein